MNKLKFRQPILNKDGTFKEWFYWGDTEDGWVEAAIQLNGHDTRRQSQRYTTQTNLDGKDIYEGDWVRMYFVDKLGKRISYNDDPPKLVHWNGSFFLPLYPCTCGCCHHEEDDFTMGHDYEVIGNNYENPELTTIAASWEDD